MYTGLAQPEVKMNGLSEENSTAFTSSSMRAVVRAMKARSADCIRRVRRKVARILAGRASTPRGPRRYNASTYVYERRRHAPVYALRTARGRIDRNSPGSRCPVVPLRREGRQEILRPDDPGPVHRPIGRAAGQTGHARAAHRKPERGRQGAEEGFGKEKGRGSGGEEGRRPAQSRVARNLLERQGHRGRARPGTRRQPAGGEGDQPADRGNQEAPGGARRGDGVLQEESGPGEAAERRQGGAGRPRSPAEPARSQEEGGRLDQRALRRGQEALRRADRQEVAEGEARRA